MEVAGGQIQGARARQEDAYAIEPVGEGTLVIVADGLGGEPHGDVASHELVKAFASGFRLPDGDATTSVLPALINALAGAHGHLLRLQEENADLTGMCSTLVAAYMQDDVLWYISVGDSLLLAWRDSALNQLNELHTDPATGFLTSCVGSHMPLVDCRGPLQCQPGDCVLLATDGLLFIREEGITAALSEAASAKEAIRKLLRTVDDFGHPEQDNTTVIVAISQQEDALSGAA
jgi:protein phosphatase